MRTLVTKVITLLVIPLAVLSLLSALSSSSSSTSSSSNKTLKIVTTTPLFADLVKQVGKSLVDVKSLIPAGADPHSYEPSLQTVRDVAHADLAFSNQLLLEEQRLITAIDANISNPLNHIAIAQTSRSHGAKVITLVENVALDTLWLGMRVQGKTENSHGSVRFTAKNVSGPGDISAFITGTFGQPDIYFSSHDGIDSHDSVTLPLNAHTHMSWAFTKPGFYTLTIEAALENTDGSKKLLGTGKIIFAVGVDPHTANRPTILQKDHVDITAFINPQSNPLHSGLAFFGDVRPQGKLGYASLDDVVVAIPYTTLSKVPPTSAYRFLGHPEDEVYIIAQAVIGKHVHGELDPHLWQDVKNTIAYVEVIEHELSRVDALHADIYHQNATEYIKELTTLDQYVRQVISSIPTKSREIVTTHDGFGYLAKAYDIRVAGFVAPNPAQEPSTQDLVTLTRTLIGLRVPAVFLEPNSLSHRDTIVNLANRIGIQVCELYSDTFFGDVQDYVSIMATNAKNLKSCLDPDSIPAWDFKATPNRIQKN